MTAIRKTGMYFYGSTLTVLFLVISDHLGVMLSLVSVHGQISLMAQAASSTRLNVY